MPTDPPGFQIRAIELSAMIPKNNFIRRYFLEVDYAKRLVAEVEHSGAEVILSGNTPSIPQERLARWCRGHGVRLVSWVQDVYGLAAYRMLRNKLPVIGQLVGKYFIALDKRAFRNSHAIVVISEDFTEILVELGRRPRADPHRPQLGAARRPARSGRATTTGRAPSSSATSSVSSTAARSRCATIRRCCSSSPACCSKNRSASWSSSPKGRVSNGSPLKPRSKTSPRSSGSRFQPFESLPDVLGSADVLVAILEPDAGVFCVPSKVLSYLCAGRPVLLAVPLENLVSRIVKNEGAGLGVDPLDVDGFCRRRPPTRRVARTCVKRRATPLATTPTPTSTSNESPTASSKSAAPDPLILPRRRIPPRPRTLAPFHPAS